jgi:DNA-binding NarL/FixJ family response regulator
VSDGEAHLFAALRAGASGYLVKDMDPRRLPQALLAAADGEPAIPRRLVARLVEDMRDRSARRRPVVDTEGVRLTSREWEVLELMRRGLTTAQIARRLVLSPATVRTHVAAITRKLRVDGREEAVRLFAERP